MLREHFPYAVVAFLSAEIAAGRFDLMVLSLALAVLLIPVVYGPDADALMDANQRRKQDTEDSNRR